MGLNGTSAIHKPNHWQSFFRQILYTFTTLFTNVVNRTKEGKVYIRLHEWANLFMWFLQLVSLKVSSSLVGNRLECWLKWKDCQHVVAAIYGPILWHVSAFYLYLCPLLDEFDLFRPLTCICSMDQASCRLSTVDEFFFLVRSYCHSIRRPRFCLVIVTWQHSVQLQSIQVNTWSVEVSWYRYSESIRFGATPLSC